MVISAKAPSVVFQSIGKEVWSWSRSWRGRVLETRKARVERQKEEHDILRTKVFRASR